MYFSTSILAATALSLASAADLKSLVVGDTPQTLRPYLLPYLSGSVLSAGTVAYRFPVTSNSSGGAFTLLTTNTNTATELSVLSHKHERRYENFFCSRGSVQLWLGLNGTENVMQGKGAQQARVLEPMDFGASSPWTTHTFQTASMDTEMYGVVFPGGLEDLFYSSFPAALNFSTPTPYSPTATFPMPPLPPTLTNGSNATVPVPNGPPPSFNISQFDIYPDTTFVPRRDFINGSAPASAGWQVNFTTLPEDDTTPYFVRKDMGSKYLVKESDGDYQIVQPLSTSVQSGSHNFTLSWITISQGAGKNITRNYAGHAAFKVEQGGLELAVEGYNTELMLQGDVAFIPGGTSYKYWAKGASARVLAVSAGANGLASDLIKKGTSWDWPVWPTS